jgi:hypothetical protein
MKKNKLIIVNLNINHLKSIKNIWNNSLPLNIKSIIGKSLISEYLKKYFKSSANRGFGIIKSNRLVGFVLFGNDSLIVKELIKENYLIIIKSFFLNILKLKISKILNYFNVVFFILISQNKEKKLRNFNELLIIGIDNKQQGKGLGSFLIKNSIKKNKKYFLKYKKIYVKTLKFTPENIQFYIKNNFIFNFSLFGRVYLYLNIKK